MNEPTAAMRYKAVIAEARKAADNLRAWELTRADELSAARPAAEAEVAAATEHEQEIDRQAHHWWRMASDIVSRLSWIRAGEAPEPAHAAQGERVREYSDAIRPAYQELNQAVLALGWRAR